MSYFDETYTGGADGSDDDEKNSSGSDSDAETNIDEDEVGIEVEEDEDVAEVKESDDEDDIEVEGKKIDYKKKFGVDFGSDDEEDVVDVVDDGALLGSKYQLYA